MKTQQSKHLSNNTTLKTIFLELGIPKTIVTDGGPQFNTEFQDFAKIWHFQHIKSSPIIHSPMAKLKGLCRQLKQL